jgi:hypothetical protein
MLMFKCRECCSNSAQPSRKRSAFECVLLPLFLLRPVRCEYCCKRQYVTVLCQVRERQPERPQSRRIAA